jgi:hypothetical protein
MPKITGLTIEYKLPDWLESLFGSKNIEESSADLLERFKESAADYEQALTNYELELKRPVPPPSDVLIETLKRWFNMRLTALEEGVTALIDGRQVSQPRAIIIFEGKNGG